MVMLNLRGSMLWLQYYLALRQCHSSIVHNKYYCSTWHLRISYPTLSQQHPEISESGL